MQTEVLGDNSIFALIPDLEPLWGVTGLLTGSEKCLALLRSIYGEDRPSRWRREYPFLFESFAAVKNREPYGMLDFLLDFPLENFRLVSYRDHILLQPEEEFIWRYLDLDYTDGADREELLRALTDDGALVRVYEWVSKDCESFLAFSAFVRQSRRFINDFFSLAEELNSPALAEALEKQTDRFRQFAQSVQAGVSELGPLDFSQQALGKTFRNRGPYDEFVFLPAYLLPCRAVRFYPIAGERKRQLLFLSVSDVRRQREDTLRTLKAVSDATRYQILTLLASEGPLRGLDIAKRLSIAASTVSHHMEQLKEGRWITEEQVKSSKYYGLDRKNAAALLDELKNDFKL